MIIMAAAVLEKQLRWHQLIGRTMHGHALR
jgi:hypothetical protein